MVVSAHQENAIICLSLLKDLAEKTVSFRRVISQVLVDPSYLVKRKSILDKFFTSDSSLWICKCLGIEHLVCLIGDYSAHTYVRACCSGENILAPVGNEQCLHGPKPEEGNGHFSVCQLL